MRYLGASAVVLVAAMTFSLTPLGRTARASDDKPVVRSMLDSNTILPFAANSFSTITYGIERYMNPPTLLEGLAEINPVTCTEVAVGIWTHTPPQLCGKEKCGKVTRGMETDKIGSGVCAGSTFTFATIYYEWTAHNNQSTLSAPPNSVADTFKVPDRGSVNPSPLGDRDAVLPECRIISAAVTRSGTASTIWFGSRNTGIRFWLETLDSAHVNCCGR